MSLPRRNLLKALAAGGALAAAAFLPEGWAKPAIEAGVLPAHAQSTVCATLEVIEGNACTAYPIACGGFTDAVRFAFTPSNLTPWRSDVTACGRTAPSDVVYDAQGYPGEFFLLFNGSDTSQCTDTRVVITFQEGCSGIWTLANNVSGRLFR